MTKITLNGEAKEIADNTTISDLLISLKVSGPLAVELNRKVCTKASHSETVIKDGDIIEIVTIVGGG